MAGTDVNITPEVLNQRMADPQTWPCGTEGINYVFRNDCRAPCCIIPAVTPEGDDTPKHVVAAAQHAAAMEGIPQPSFDNVEAEAEADFMSPPKTIFTHNRETGETCIRGLNARVDAAHWGVPGKSDKDPVIVDTPSRDKK